MKKQKRRSVEEARRIHIEAKNVLKEEIKKEKEMKITPQDKIKMIYQKAQEEKRKRETLRADEEPTVLHQIILPDEPTEEFQPTSLQEEIQNLTKISSLTNKEKKDILNLALKVKELNDKYDLLNNNIINLYHLTRK